MDYQKVTAGQEVVRSAARENAWTDAAIWVRQQTGGRTAFGKTPWPNPGVILVKNISGAQQQRYTAMALLSPVVTPAVNQSEFETRIAMNVDVPLDEDKGRWCVLLQDVNDEEIGLAVVSGAVQCQINLTATDDTAVEIADGAVYPVGGQQGMATILWVAGGVGTATSTGLQPSIIRLGGGSGELPTGEFQYMAYVMVSQNQAGFDYIRAHAATP